MKSIDPFITRAKKLVFWILRQIMPAVIRYASFLGSETSSVIIQCTGWPKNSDRGKFVEVALGTIRACGWGFGWSEKNEQVNFDARKSVLNIVGSGASLNRLTPNELNLLSRGDIMTLNFSHLADVTPKYSLITLPTETFLGRSQFSSDDFWFQYKKLMKQTFGRNLEKFNDTIFFLRPSTTFGGKLFKSDLAKWFQENFPTDHIKFLNVIYFSPPFKPDLDTIFEQSKNFIKALESPGPRYIPKFGSSLPLAITLGVSLGYRKICLFGFDLLNDEHFYDHEPWLSMYDRSVEFDKVLYPTGKSFDLHDVMNNSTRGSTQLEEVSELVKLLHIHLQIDISLINSDSRFSEHLPIVNSSWYE
jgi:hypothetical protein